MLLCNKKIPPEYTERILSGWQDSNLRPPAPKAGDNRATLHPESGCKYRTIFCFCKIISEIRINFYLAIISPKKGSSKYSNKDFCHFLQENNDILTLVSDLEIIAAKIQVINTANGLAQMEVESFAAGVPIFFRTEKSDQRKLLLWH